MMRSKRAGLGSFDSERNNVIIHKTKAAALREREGYHTAAACWVITSVWVRFTAATGHGKGIVPSEDAKAHRLQHERRDVKLPPPAWF